MINCKCEISLHCYTCQNQDFVPFSNMLFLSYVFEPILASNFYHILSYLILSYRSDLILYYLLNAFTSIVTMQCSTRPFWHVSQKLCIEIGHSANELRNNHVKRRTSLLSSSYTGCGVLLCLWCTFRKAFLRNYGVFCVQVRRLWQHSKFSLSPTVTRGWSMQSVNQTFNVYLEGEGHNKTFYGILFIMFGSNTFLWVFIYLQRFYIKRR